MPAPKKAEETVPPKDEPEEKTAPAVKPKAKPKAEADADEAPVDPKPKSVPKPKLPKLRPREWFDHILPNAKGEGFLGFHTREIPEAPKAKAEDE